ncbi:MAG TPA: DolP-mannose mannosyltransferase [Blastocatellia bacterium]|nr:DolP-mannose mannosyltransferase [Blastocatellia bacterium]
MVIKRSVSALVEQANRTSSTKLALSIFLLGTAITLMYRPFSQPEVGDPAIYDYIAQSILRGQMPYRDVVDIKGPLAAHLSALSMLAGKPVGLRDIIAVRLLHVLMVGLLCAATFAVGTIYLKSRAAGILAALVPLCFPTFIEMMVAGTQPKLPMMVFGLLSLVLIAKDQPFWAGFCSMLSCLCWQPGLMFAGVAVLIFSRYLSSWRDGRALKVFAGTAIPLIVTLAYFYVRGSLGEMWAWTITYNYSVFGPAAKRPLAEASDHLFKIMHRIFRRDIFLLVLSALGLAGYLIERIVTKVKQKQAFREPGLFADAILMPPLIYLAFCLINIQSGPDLIPFVPFIGIFIGWLMVKGQRALSRTGENGPLPGSAILVPVLSITIILLIIFSHAAFYRIQGWKLKDQDKVMEAVSLMLGPNDKIYVHGTVEILVLPGKANLNPYVFLDWGADDFAAARRGTDFTALVQEMDAQAPKLVALSRLRKVNHGAELEQWVADHYDKVDSFSYESLYIRKE